MADRTVYDKQFSENGWRMVDQDSCVWITVPGTEVTLQIREGQPVWLLRAWAADWNAFIEPLRDADSACWTPTNSVATSNHLSGTAIDLNWNSHPFRQRGSLNAAQMGALEEMEKFYEGTVFWAGRWDDPADEMHSQVGYNTYGSQHVARVQDFINRKIRADGFSTFRRGGVVTPPPPVSNQVDILAHATGVTPAKAQQILVGVVNGLRDSQCNNVNRIAMWLAQIGHESAGFNATEEYESGDESTDRWKYKGRTWIQITWLSNYLGLSKWAFGEGLIPSLTYFVDNPKKLAEIQYAGLGPAWYWTVARPQINGLCDKRDLIAVTQAINGGQNGAVDRKNRYDRALALGDQLLALTAAAEPGDDFLSALTDAEQRELLELSRQQAKYRRKSLSPFRWPFEGDANTCAGFAWTTDANVHVQLVEKLAVIYGDPQSIGMLLAVSRTNEPGRADDAALALRVLNRVTPAGKALGETWLAEHDIKVTA